VGYSFDSEDLSGLVASSEVQSAALHIKCLLDIRDYENSDVLCIPAFKPIEGLGKFAFFLNIMELAAGLSDSSSIFTWPCIILCMKRGAISLLPPLSVEQVKHLGYLKHLTFQ
jgi:hypothetical protein